ncbi:MAG TPA: tetratricopeptide repeat protein [Verrucomicrobiae bacterium]|nr:tetratricopeptide repeat protein [Verrucomicrobiae bacterium]
MTFPGPSQANAAAIDLRAQGRLPDAIATLREGIAQFPQVAALRQNLAQVLYESGDLTGAVAQHRAVLDLEPDNLASNLGLYELLQIAGERDEALRHQRAALRVRRLYSHIAPHEKRSVLCLCMPGDWQANIPVDFLFDHDSTTVHKLYLVDQHDLVPPNLRYDVVWNIIAESPEALPHLALANHFIRAQSQPALNAPARVITTARPLLDATLANTRARVAPVAIIDRERLSNAAIPFAFPIIARPLGSHAGHGLERIGDREGCEPYTRRNPVERYFVSPFIDYASGDGFYRKYRLVYVDGAPYPVHLAISPNWMIHYYNAPMSEHAWMREEEAAFLADPRAAFNGQAFETLVRVGAAVGLEYFGIDCGIDRDGNVLVFEADAAMLVHTSDPIELYPYKHQFVPRIYRAVEALLDRYTSAD